jgi:hypothetical protein
MQVNIITEQQEWICQRAAQELLPLGWTLNGRQGVSDVDYYLPYTRWDKKRDNIQAAYFTHYEPPTDKKSREKGRLFDAVLASVNLRIAMSKKTASVMSPVRADAVIQMASQFSRKIVFGVCGQVYPSGRKNDGFIAGLVSQGVCVVFFGKGWAGTQFEGSLEEFYRAIDYLIIPSANEGGPVPVLEALSLGCPVIAPDVGWCWEYPVIRYDVNSFESLARVVKGLSSVRSWDQWRAEHLSFFEKALT